MANPRPRLCGQSWPQPAFQPALRRIQRSRLAVPCPFRPALYPEAPLSRDQRERFEITARALEVLGAKEKALRWLKTPVRSLLGGRTPLSLLDEPGGIERVEDALSRIEHGVW